MQTGILYWKVKGVHGYTNIVSFVSFIGKEKSWLTKYKNISNYIIMLYMFVLRTTNKPNDKRTYH